MTRALSTTDRALIDAAIAQGKLRKVPRGASAFPLPVWNGSTLVYPDWEEQKRRQQAAQWKARTSSAIEAAAAERRVVVAELHAEGLTMPQMKDRIGVSIDTLKRDHEALGLQFHRVTGFTRRVLGPRKRSAVVEARRDRVARMRTDGATAREIAAQLGTTLANIETDIRILRAEGRVPDFSARIGGKKAKAA